MCRENEASLIRFRFRVFFGALCGTNIFGKVESDEERERQAKRDRLDAEWKQARIDAELARQKVHAAKSLEMKGALIPRQLVQKQAAFLVLSMRRRLLQVAEQHADELLVLAGDQRSARDDLSDAIGAAARR